MSTTSLPKAVARKYNILAYLYDWIWPNYIRKTVRSAAKNIRLNGGEKILDVGCGTGALAKVLLKKNAGIRILGIDISRDMLQRARKKFKNFPQAVFREADFAKTAVEENAFDLAFSLSNLHYFSDPPAFVKKIRRALKQGGRFVLVDWDRSSLRGKFYDWYMRWMDPAFHKAHTQEEAIRLLEENGFIVEKKKGFWVAPLWYMMTLVGRKT